MTYSKMLQILPMIIVLILFLFFIFKNYLSNHKNLFYKMVWSLTWTSFSLVFVFSFFYLLVFAMDLQALRDANMNNITPEMLTSFQPLKPHQYEEGISYFIFDIFLYSVSVFFHTPSQFQVIGPAQGMVVLEGAIGYLWPIMILILTLKKENDSNKEQIEVLQIYLNRGWNVLRLRKTDITGFQAIELLSEDNTQMEILFIKESALLNELIKRFRINWENATLDMIPYFARFLEEPINEKNDYKIAFESMLFYNRKGKINVEYYRDFHKFLLKISLLPGMADYQGSIIHMMKLLENYLDDDQEIDLIEQLLQGQVLEVKADE